MMNWAIALAGLTMAAVTQCRADTPEWAAEVDAADRARLEELNAIWLKSYETRDQEALGSVLADDFIGLYGEATLSKQEMLARLSTRPPTKVNWEKLRIKVNRDTAVVTAASTITTQQEGKEASARFNYVDVYSRRNGDWRAIASHVTRLAD